MGDTEEIEPSTVEGVLQLLNIENESTIPKLFECWNEIGYSKKTITRYGLEVIAHHKELFNDMLVELQSRKSQLLKNVEEMVEKMVQISTELKVHVNLDYKNEPLIEVASKLTDELKILQKLKEERLTKYKKLLEKEHEICQVLGTKAVGLNTSLPNENELKKFNIYLSEQEEEMIKLKKIFQKMHTEIIDMISELEYEPVDEFEKIICNNYDNFIYTGNNMTKLREFRDKLNDEIEALKELAENKRQELIKLWDFLDVPKDTYTKFLNKYCGFDTATITALNKEIKQCKEIQKENMSLYIKKIRDEIIEWWDICRIGQTERDSFLPFNYETYNEDALAIHEMELEKLRRYYQDNKKIFDVLKLEKEMWDKGKELALREDDPNRFNNRGGQLLEEEKQRKTIKKEFPKIEAELIQLLEQYEKINHKEFLIDGLNYQEYRARETELFRMEKENVKAARTHAKDVKKSAKKTPLSASRRNLGLTTTLRNARTSVKRKIDVSPVMCNSKKRMINSEKSRTLSSRARRSGQLHVSRKLLSSSPFNTSKGSIKLKTPKKKNTTTIVTSDDLTPYEEFQNGLAHRDELRSTLVSSELIQPKSSKLTKTPVKTPAKPTRKRPVIGTPRLLRPGSGTPGNKSPQITGTPRLTAARGEYNF